jgi:hypothetical protein
MRFNILLLSWLLGISGCVSHPVTHEWINDKDWSEMGRLSPVSNR